MKVSFAVRGAAPRARGKRLNRGVFQKVFETVPSEFISIYSCFLFVGIFMYFCWMS